MASKTLPKPPRHTGTDNKCTGKTSTETQPDNSKCTAATGKDAGATGIETND